MSKNRFVLSLMKCVKILRQQDIISYPTESMFGLGCDPSSKIAVDKLLNLKQRNVDKGFILVAANYNQLRMYVNEQKISYSQKKKMFLYWPGPFTFIVPASTLAPFWITGKFNTVAIRISKHIPIVQLCCMFGKAVISTSANFSGMSPCLTRSEVFRQFGKNFPLLDGNIGYQKSPSSIINIINGQFIRNVKKEKK